MVRFFLLIFLVSLIVAPAEGAEGTETLLINKLTNVFLKLPEGNPTKTKITLRLADLHAERGRLTAKRELEKGCIECSNGEKDRAKALEYYEYVLPTLPAEQKQKVMVQIGHLYEVLGKSSKAISFYKKVISGSQGGARAEAQFSLAEIYFKDRKFSQAGKFYSQALGEKSFRRRGLASFRLAWCQYNTGNIGTAVKGLEKVLRDPKLLTRGGEGLVNVDADFQAEVAKDFTVFMAHSSQINLTAIKTVYELSPDSSKIENVSFLAKELERLGRNQQSQEAWELVIDKTGNPEVRMEALVYLAGLQLKGSNKAKILPYLKRAFGNWSTLQGCKDQRTCDELRSRVRNLVFDWNRMEKAKPSASLIEAYEAYFRVAPEDTKALELAGQAAVLAKDYERAYGWNKKAFTLAKEDKLKETLLLRRIEIAELAKNEAWLEVSQKVYLEKSPTQAKSPEIRYAMAQRLYDGKDYAAASEAFYSLAKNDKATSKIRLQSAEMALDTLVLAKNDVKIEGWSQEFAGLFPSQAKRFGGIAGASILSQTAALSTGTGSAEQAWVTLGRFDVQSADAEKKKTYYKNRVILARQLKKFSEMDSALRSYSALKGLNKDELRFGLENRVWLAEIQLNFAEAYRSYKKLGTKNWLELARLADLAEKPSEKYYFNYLRKPADKKLAFSICVKLVKEAGKLSGSYKACVPHLKTDKELFAGMVLEMNAKVAPKALNKKLRSYGLEKTAVAHVIKRSLLLEEGKGRLARLEKHKLDGRTHRVAGSLKTRMARITKFEQTISKATETGDWLTQTLFLSQLQQQYMRFFNDLLALPTPKDLTPEEQQEYVTLLSQQAAPYKEKADSIQFKIDELWKNEKAIDQVYSDFHRAGREIQSLLGPQIDLIREFTPEAQKDRFALVYKSEQKPKVPSIALLETARAQVKQDPLNRTALQNLIRLETQRGYQPMIIYLNSRLDLVDQGFENKEKAL